MIFSLGTCVPSSQEVSLLAGRKEKRKKKTKGEEKNYEGKLEKRAQIFLSVYMRINSSPI